MKEKLTDLSGLHAFSIMLMDMHFSDEASIEMCDLIVKKKMERFLSGVMHFGVILFQVCTADLIVSKKAHPSCVSGETFF